MQTSRGKIEAYEICQTRGHESDGMIMGHENYAEYTCKWCGVRYYIQPAKVIEIDAPKQEVEK